MITRAYGGTRRWRFVVTTAVSVAVGILMVASTSTPALAERQAGVAGGNAVQAVLPSEAAGILDELQSVTASTAAANPESVARLIQEAEAAQISDPRDVVVFNLLERAIDLIDEALADPNLNPTLRSLLQRLLDVLVSEIGFCLLRFIGETVLTELIIAFLTLVVVVVGLIVTSPFVLLVIGVILIGLGHAFRLYDAIKNIYDFATCAPKIIDVPPVGDPDRAAPPSNLTADYDCLDNAIYLDFNDNSTNETGFRVRDLRTGYVEDFPAHSGTGQHTIILPIFESGSPLMNDFRHTFTVSALSEQGESPPSNPAFVAVQCAA